MYPTSLAINPSTVASYLTVVLVNIFIPASSARLDITNVDTAFQGDSELDSAFLTLHSPGKCGAEPFEFIQTSVDKAMNHQNEPVLLQKPVETRRQAREKRRKVKEGIQMFMANEALKQSLVGKMNEHVRRDMPEVMTGAVDGSNQRIQLAQRSMQDWIVAWPNFQLTNERYKVANAPRSRAKELKLQRRQNVENVGPINGEMQRIMQDHAMSLRNRNRSIPRSVRPEKRTAARTQQDAGELKCKSEDEEQRSVDRVNTRKEDLEIVRRKTPHRQTSARLETVAEDMMLEKRSRSPPPPDRAGASQSDASSEHSSKGKDKNPWPQLTSSAGEHILFNVGKQLEKQQEAAQKESEAAYGRYRDQNMVSHQGFLGLHLAQTVQQAKISLNQYRTARNAETKHLKEMQSARKKVREKGTDIEHIGMVNKDFQKKMRKHFPPVVNMNARFEKDLLRTYKVRAQREQAEAGQKKARAGFVETTDAKKASKGATRGRRSNRKDGGRPVFNGLKAFGSRVRSSFERARARIKAPMVDRSKRDDMHKRQTKGIKRESQNRVSPKRTADVRRRVSDSLQRVGAQLRHSIVDRGGNGRHAQSSLKSSGGGNPGGSTPRRSQSMTLGNKRSGGSKR